MKNKVVVVGSLNYDQSIRLDHLPTIGETILSNDVSYAFGGKGANQAVAIAKMNVGVSMIGAVGDDKVGEQMIENLKKYQVDTDGIVIKEHETSGFALIYIDPQGKNMIVVHPGANYKITIDDIKAKEHLLVEAEYCLLQLEIPLDVIAYVVSLCQEYGVKVLLNPAPAQKLSKDILSKVTYLVPNESELANLVGCEVSVETVVESSQPLLALGVDKLIVTMGEHGSCFVSKDKHFFVEAVKVNAIDTTAAGDSFLGAFLAGLAKGYTEQEAMQFGSKVASITVTRQGAQDAIPMLEEVV